jgi:predicted transcriptional regulator of viral defense system
VEQYVSDLAAQGRHDFTLDEAVAALGGSRPAVRAALRRLRVDGKVTAPARGFWLVVPPEYRRVGCLPPEQFVPRLMERLGLRYYVTLLSAAEFHGAAHQRPQVFQVMLKKNRRRLVCGQVRVQFLARADLARTPTASFNTPRGPVQVASAEATALELVGYADEAGGLDNVVTVLDDLAEALDAGRLAAAAELAPVTWAQRLGYLLELGGHQEPADALESHIRRLRPVLAALVRRRPVTGAVRSARWRLAVNADVAGEP